MISMLRWVSLVEVHRFFRGSNLGVRERAWAENTKCEMKNGEVLLLRGMGVILHNLRTEGNILKTEWCVYGLKPRTLSLVVTGLILNKGTFILNFPTLRNIG